jgi:hypothetical protein
MHLDTFLSRRMAFDNTKLNDVVSDVSVRANDARRLNMACHVILHLDSNAASDSSPLQHSNNP